MRGIFDDHQRSTKSRKANRMGDTKPKSVLSWHRRNDSKPKRLSINGKEFKLIS